MMALSEFIPVWDKLTDAQRVVLTAAAVRHTADRGTVLHNGSLDCTGLLLVEQILWKSFDKRLADFLLEESAIEGTNCLKITHEAVGNHMGNPREVVTRMLRYFQNEGMVKLSRGTIEILEPRRLRALAGM